MYLLLIKSNQHPINSVPFTLESVHNFHPSSSRSLIPAQLHSLQLSVWFTGIILERLCFVCFRVLAQRTVWQRCRWIFDLLSVRSVLLSLQSLTHWAD